jgi:transposase
VIESTGCYSQQVARLLTTAGYRVTVVQPGRIRQYARSQGLLAKTDAIDARIIAQYGEHSPGLRVYAEPSPTRQRLRALVDRRDQLVEDRVREENRLEACSDAVVQKGLRQSIVKLRKQADALERDMANLIASDGELAAMRDILESLKGIGSITAATLLAHLPELGQVNRQEIAALAGVAPYNNDSGGHQGTRSIFGGRQRVRNAMHMAAVTAMRWDETFSAFYAGLRDRGKPTKVAIVAVIRKMLIKLNSLMFTYHQKRSPTMPAEA